MEEKGKLDNKGNLRFYRDTEGTSILFEYDYQNRLTYRKEVKANKNIETFIEYIDKKIITITIENGRLTLEITPNDEVTTYFTHTRIKQLLYKIKNDWIK